MVPRYIYKVYRRGVFVGLLPNVTSIFSYRNQINTAGPSLTIDLAVPFDDAGAELITERIVDENGNYLVDENGDYILGSKYYQFSNVPIDLGNRVVAIQIDEDNPTGRTVFDGMISKWSGPYGDNYGIKLTVLSYGVQLDNYLISSGTSAAVEQTLSTTTKSFANWGASTNRIALAQSFNSPSNANLVAVDLRLALTSLKPQTPLSVVVQLRATGANPSSSSSSLVTSSEVIVDSTTERVYTFSFPEPYALVSGTNYYLFITTTDPVVPGSDRYQIALGTDNSDSYVNGSLWVAVNGAGVTDPYTKSAVSWTEQATENAYFKVYVSSGNLIAPYLSTDPSDMLRDIIGDYNLEGGVITYDEDSIDDTGSIATYTFKMQTIYNGVEITRKLSPSNWYDYVDPATNLLHRHRKGRNADHLFVKGVHISNLIVERSLENVKNKAYLSGGDTGGGENLLTVGSNQSSIDNYGQWLALESDNRVTDTETGGIIVNGIISRGDAPLFNTPVVISRAVYPIDTIFEGQMVGFRGYMNLIDALILQIVDIERHRDYVRLTLDSLPPDVTKRVEDIKRNLDLLETINNPDTPT